MVDFYVSPRRAGSGRAQHGALTRTLWPRWFAHDGVRLAPDVLDRLTAIAAPSWLAERNARMPYLPLLRVPYFVYVGIKPG